MVEPTIRYPAVAGSFYPNDKEELQDMINEFMVEAENVEIDGKIKGLVVPHAGYVYSGPIAAYGYKALQKQVESIKKIMLVGVSHFTGFFGAAEAGTEFWETPLGRVKVESVRSKIKNKELINVIPQAHVREHCLEVQLPFLQTIMNDFSIYALLTGEVVAAALSDALEPVIDNETIFIASSDLSHYHSYGKAVALDGICNEAIPKLDIETMKTKGDACGKTGILTLMHIAKKRKWKGKLLNYRNSGDTAGTKDQVVGYGCYAFYEDD